MERGRERDKGVLNSGKDTEQQRKTKEAKRISDRK